MHVILPEVGTAQAWRDQARALVGAGVPPEAVTWSLGAGESNLFADDLAAAGGDLFGATPPTPPSKGRSDALTAGTPHAAPSVPRSFVALSRSVCWHCDPERFARLYALLWRLKENPRLMADRADPALTRLWSMEKSVRRDLHKMRAFLRFREVGNPDAPRRSFAAWFEPDHRIVEPNAEFFARRFGDMDWLIATPTLTARFADGRVTFEPGQSRPPLPEDASEALWTTYFRNIFNPARLKVKAMTAEMPRKYWKNMPEAAAIPDLIATAVPRAAEMRANAPTMPPVRAERILSRMTPKYPPAESPDTLEGVARALEHCRRCPLYGPATQAVPGEGPPDAEIMFVGEQPGDREDLEGRPFVGPAGQLFDRIAAEAGIDRGRAYVTNAVKHFKYQPRGKRRIHQRPDAGEVQACRWWLDLERRLVAPKLIVAMGATAIGALTSNSKGVTKRRGQIETTPDGTQVLITVHPSYLLRLPSETARAEEEARFRTDLERAAEFLRRAA
jgi:probable DNA metabolism protein